MDLASFASNINKAHLGTLNVKENWACMKWLHWNISCFCKCRSMIISYSMSLSSALWFFFKLSFLTQAASTIFLSYVVFNLWIACMQILSNYTTSQVIDHIKVYSPQTLLIELQFQKAWKKKRYIFNTQDIKSGHLFPRETGKYYSRHVESPYTFPEQVYLSMAGDVISYPHKAN